MMAEPPLTSLDGIGAWRAHAPRTKETQTIYGANVVVFEGILTLHDPELVALMDMRIFVDTDDDVRLARRRMLGTPDASGAEELLLMLRTILRMTNGQCYETWRSVAVT